MNCVHILVLDMQDWENKLAQLKDAFPTLVTNVGGSWDKTLWWEMESQSEDSEQAAADMIDRLWGDAVYTHEDKHLSVLLQEALRAHGFTISVAESLTGGALAAGIVRFPGSSDVFHTGIVAYSNQTKSQMLGVDEGLLADKGAVSSEVAAAMAKGALQCAGSNIAVSTTGIAGPVGDGMCQTVGLTYIGVATSTGTQTYMHIFNGDRSAVRYQAVKWAMLYALRTIQKM